MLRLLVPAAAGILLAAYWEVPWWGWIAAAALCGAGTLFFRSGLYALLTVLFTASAATGLRLAAVTPPLGEPLLAEVQVDERPHASRSGETAVARVVAWCDPAGAWHGAECRVRLYADSLQPLPAAGSRLKVLGRIRPYGRGPLRRECGSLRVGRRQLLSVDTVPSPGFGGRLHAALLRRIGRLGLAPDRQAVVEAMAAGERSAVDPALRQAYTRSGAAHLLAVSGLHIGVVLLAANLLLGFLPLVRHGHRLRNVLAVATVWLYVAAIGAPPSALRAACMGTILQYALAASAPYAGLNGLFGAATVLLLFDPLLLFDAGFQLSCTAVFAILAWAVPLVRPLRRSALRWLAGTLAAGCCATVATAPLIARTFGLFSLAGVALNPVVVLTAQGIVAAALLWICFPLGVWQPAASGLLSGLVGLQNGLVTRLSAWEWAAFAWRPPALATAAVYLLFLGATLLIWSAERPQPTLSLHDEP